MAPIRPNESPLHLKDLEEMREQVKAEAARVSADWPDWAKDGAEQSLMERIPESGNDAAGKPKTAFGADAGLLAALGAIPRDKQKLACALHAVYTKESVEQVRQEAQNMNPNSPTAWWLTGCAVCNENGAVDEAKFREQLKTFEELAASPEKRLAAAKEAYTGMTGKGSFSTERYGVPYGEKDGCSIQGAYIAGWPFGTSFNAQYNMYEISTYEPSLGDFSDFPWENPDTIGDGGKRVLGTSGHIWGSPQRIKCASEKEFLAVLERVKKNLPERPTAVATRDKVTAAMAPRKLDEKKSFTFPVIVPGTLEPMEVGGQKFAPKAEHHLTVVGFKRGSELKKAFKAAPDKEAAVNALLEAVDWSYEVLPDKYLVKKDTVDRKTLSKQEKRDRAAQGLPAVDFVETPVHKESVIQMVKCGGLAEFYRRMKEEVGIDLGEVPPAHVTVYTLEGEAQGIGIDSEAALAALKPQKLNA